MKLIAANIVTAFSSETIGTKVVNTDLFFEVATAAVAAFDFDGQRVPGQGFIPCNDLAPVLSAGVGKRSENPEDYVLRFYRGRVETFLRRSHAASCEGAALVVYTREAYLADPDVQNDKDETFRIEATDATHVIVAILGFAGPKAPLSPYRLVHNLAGGNKEALTWSADEIRAQAKASLDYDNEWAVVAD